MSEGRESMIAAVAALNDELRRAMYDFIRQARRPVGRDEAAAAAGISRKLAAFHLDKLVAAGLLQARFEAISGARRVGRTPKVYEPVGADVGVTIPQRRHDLLAGILLDAVLAESETETARQAALRAARLRGRDLGAAERAGSHQGPEGAPGSLNQAAGVLARYGFEPERHTPGCVRLRNCPFNPLVRRSPELVCALNHAFLRGFLDGLGGRGVEVVVESVVGDCCVQLRHRSS